MLRAFVDEVVFAREGVAACTVDPSPRNMSAIRAYEKAGFAHLKTVQLPGEAEPSYVMIKRRSPETS